MCIRSTACASQLSTLTRLRSASERAVQPRVHRAHPRRLAPKGSLHPAPLSARLGATVSAAWLGRQAPTAPLACQPVRRPGKPARLHAQDFLRLGGRGG